MPISPRRKRNRKRIAKPVDYIKASQEIGGLLSPQKFSDLHSLVKDMKKKGYQAQFVPLPGQEKVSHIIIDFIPLE